MEHLQEANQFLEVMSQLGSRLGPLFLQLPPHYSPLLLEDLRAFLKAWPPQARLAVEVRYTGWFEALHGAQAFVFCHCPDERLDPRLCREFHRRVREKVPSPG